MNLLILAGGRARAAAETAAAESYLKRAAASGRRLGIGAAELIEIDERKPDYLARLPPGAVLVALDERGEDLSSRAFADRLQRWLDESVPALALAIGPADGLPPPVRAAARFTLAYGRATWPHLLVRAMAAEQLYRAITLLTGHPYHRD